MSLRLAANPGYYDPRAEDAGTAEFVEQLIGDAFKKLQVTKINY